jgi:asparagine synthase (glutamine-hydrolysing)
MIHVLREFSGAIQPLEFVRILGSLGHRMCGICGVVGMKAGQETEALVRRMMAALVHRGPDEDGFLAQPQIALGMRRLSIIDLPGGHQPLYNEDGSIALVFNGEIYNFQELRRTLEGHGHVFRTRSDTEVVVHAYEMWGEDCLSHLRGMFAFAILDARRDTGASVFIARDRLGIKPLYYSLADGALFFASEVRALLASGRIPRQLSPAALESYILFGSVSEPSSLIDGVFSLPPGHFFRVTPSADRPIETPHPQPYWNFSPPGRVSQRARLQHSEQVTENLRSLLEDAVRSHLIADVPLGIFLSSGIDSTALAALAARERAGIHTFTVVFPEQEFSEAPLARRTAERLGTRHQELLLSGEDMLARLADAAAALDQPTMDGINTYFVSWAARQVGLKVALSGLGGDEVFGGYSTFRTAPQMRRLAAVARRVPRSLRSATAAGVARLGNGSGRRDAGRKLASVWRDPQFLPHPYFYSRALFAPDQAAELLKDGLSHESSPWRAWLSDAARDASRFDEFTAVSVLEARSYMVNTLLRDTDSVSMHHSLEVRVPLLDHPLVEFVTALPGSMKRAGKLPKALLVRALQDLLPQEIVGQPKRTFTFPWEHWLRGPLQPRVAASLHDLAPALRPLLNPHAVESVWQDFLSGRTNWSRPWSLFVLNEWVRSHVAEEDSSAGSTRRASAVTSAGQRTA